MSACVGRGEDSDAAYTNINCWLSAMKIHISKVTKEYLEVTDNYNILSRGEIDVKVKVFAFVGAAAVAGIPICLVC